MVVKKGDGVKNGYLIFFNSLEYNSNIAIL